MNKAAKILFLTHHSNFIGGGELSQVELMKGLYDLGVNTMLGVPSPGWTEQQVSEFGGQVLHLKMPKIGLWNVVMTVCQWLRDIKKIGAVDVIHANTSRACFYAGIVGKLLGIPVVFHCRIANSDPKLDVILVRLVRCVVANSHATAERFRNWPRLDVRTVYNGINTDISELPSTVKQTIGAQAVLLCVARVSRWKRHDIVLDVFNKLAQRFEGLHLVCVGAKDENEEDWWDELQLRTRESEFSERIHWAGMQEDMTKWYLGADVFILA
ncbi:MAG: glycosyltransferase family 4 protein, partial [Ghiorsea sp.]